MKYVGSTLGGVLVMVVLFAVSHAGVIYVKSTSAYPTIQSGLDAASAGDVVFVGTGTYYEHLIWPDKQGIQLLSEGGPWFTRIDGDTVGRVIEITTGVDSTTVINGFNIRNGYAATGAAIYCVNSSPTISNNLINYNESVDSSGGGGGIYCNNSSPVITGNQFAFNNAGGAGGSIWCESNSSPIIIDNTFFACRAFAGGAICLDASSAQITSNSFSTNRGDSIGGGIYGLNGSSAIITENVMYNNYSLEYSYSGGGAIIFDPNCVVTITKNVINNNRADSAAGGIGCYDGLVADNVITENHADYAAGIAIGSHGSATVSGNTITNNTANWGGGGIICAAYSTSMVRDNIISDNWGQYGGGGIICDTNSTPTIRRNTITYNGSSGVVGQGAGIRCSDTASPIIDSCVIANNDGDGIWCNTNANPIIYHNEIENNADDGVNNRDSDVLIVAENNWWGDPSGPGGAGPGSGDEVSNDVDYEPWLETSMVDSVAPATPYVVNAKVGNDAELTWNAINTDTLGNDEAVDYYIIYRSNTPSFVPGVSDSIAAVSHPDTTYTDVNALVAGTDYYYLIKAVDWKKNVSAKSNMAYVFHKSVNENASTTDRNWVALPYHNDYATVSELVADLSPSGVPVEKVTHLDDTLQQYESYVWVGMWLGPDFEIGPGQAYEMVSTVDSSLVLVGANDPEGFIDLNENPTTTDRNWVAMPYNAVYSTVSDITTEYAPSGVPVEKITRLDDTLQLYESYVWIGFMWSGPDFAIEPGTGYEFVATVDTFWNPTEYSNEAKAAELRRVPDVSTAIMTVGTSIEPAREPAWQMADGRGQSAEGTAYRVESRAQSAESIERRASGDQRAVSSVERAASEVERRAESHVVCVNIAVREHEGLLFTAYRPDSPSDVLTNECVGCGVVCTDERGVVWFDVGNFDDPWQDDEEVIVIIEAVKQGRAYYAVVDCALDVSVDIQRLGMVELVPTHEAQDNVIGYSLYRHGERVNDEILTTSAIDDDAVIRPVIRGGYETVYGSAGVQSDHRETPLSYAFGITPNPFTQQTSITYALPEQVAVDVAVYDITGRHVAQLASGRRDPGYYSTIWNGTDMHDRQVAAGVYFVKCTAGDFTAQEKVLLVK